MEVLPWVYFKLMWSVNLSVLLKEKRNFFYFNLFRTSYYFRIILFRDRIIIESSHIICLLFFRNIYYIFLQMLYLSQNVNAA